MCSRYQLTSPHEAVQQLFRLERIEPFPPRLNIAPTEPVLIIRHDLRHQREAALVRWGLIPSWVKNPAEFSTLINARSETVTVKPSFRGAIRHKRCIVPATGFYEWAGERGRKVAHLIAPREGGILGLAGLWEHWLGPDGSEIETMAILTTAANATVARIHDRMPVILAPDDFELWLDCRPGTADEVVRLLAPAPDGVLDMMPFDPRTGERPSANQGTTAPAPVKQKRLL